MSDIFIFKNAAWLDVASNQGYGRLPIPAPRDEQILALLREWQCLSEEEREAASRLITKDQMLTLLAFSERMASLAVRVRNRAFVVSGLIALGLDGWRTDWRENMLLLCLHFDASKKIGADLDSIFQEAANTLSSKVSTALVAFLKRSPADQSLEAMGYKESVDEDGFRYQRTW